MPFNLLKEYPELLELNFLGGDDRKKSLRGIFNRDIAENNNFSFRKKRIYPIKSDGNLDMEREFTHLTTVEKEETDKQGSTVKRRVYDSYRSERLHWIKPHINEVIKDNSDIEVFSVVERHKRVDVTRTYIYNKTQKYVIVLEPQIRNDVKSYYLLTAYYLNEEYGEKMLKKKMKSKIEVVL
ncbi:MAG: hypothetical protein IJ277_03315 [Bacteroidaceae bacterium]|nr:hypothetical protein [Bacteroidaceae bacterium]